jgi:hypothetical protein
MEEQRILAEIEQQLARAEPALAARLSAFGRPSRAVLLRSTQERLRSPWVLVVASLVALVMLTVMPVVVYALVSLRAVPTAHPAARSAVPAQHHAAPVHPIMSAPR